MLRELMARHGDQQGILFARRKVWPLLKWLTPAERWEVAPALLLLEYEELRGPAIPV